MNSTCPHPGTWRAFLDGEAVIGGSDEHLVTCAECAGLLARMKADAAFTRSRLAVLDPAPDRLRPVDETPVFVPAPPRRFGWLKGVAAAAVASLFLVTPIGQDTAQAVLAAFRVQQFNVVQVTATELFQTADSLYSLGTVDGAFGVEPSTGNTVEEAEALTGLRMPRSSSLDAAPLEVIVMPASTVTWTLDAGMVGAHLASEGSEIDIPAGLDGTTLVFDRGDGMAAIYGGSLNAPELIVAVSGPVSVDVAQGGMSLSEVRGFLLAVPGLPAGLVSQLEGMDDWQSTLPLPIPVEEGSARTVQLGDTEAVSFQVDGFGEGYLWVDGDVIVGVVAERGSRLLENVVEDMTS